MKKRTPKPRTRKITLHALAGGKKIKEVFDLPTSLRDAVAVYGEEAVFDHFIRNLVIKLQMQMRAKYTTKSHRRLGQGLIAAILQGDYDE